MATIITGTAGGTTAVASAVGDNVTSKAAAISISRRPSAFSIGDDWKNPLAKTRLKCAVVGTSKCADRHVLLQVCDSKCNDCAEKMDFELRGNRPRLRGCLSVPRSSNCARLSQDGRSSGTICEADAPAGSLCAAGSHHFRRLRPLEPFRPRAIANSELRAALQHQPHRRRDDQGAAQICVRKDVARYLDS